MALRRAIETSMVDQHAQSSTRGGTNLPFMSDAQERHGRILQGLCVVDVKFVAVCNCSVSIMLCCWKASCFRLNGQSAGFVWWTSSLSLFVTVVSLSCFVVGRLSCSRLNGQSAHERPMWGGYMLCLLGGCVCKACLCIAAVLCRGDCRLSSMSRHDVLPAVPAAQLAGGMLARGHVAVAGVYTAA